MRTQLLAQSPWTLSGHWSGWLILGLFTLAEAVVGRSLILGYEQLVFVGVLLVGCIFECGWYIARGANALVPESRMVPGADVGRWGDQ